VASAAATTPAAPLADAQAPATASLAAPARYNAAIGPIVLVVFLALIALAIMLSNTGHLLP
jgi:hypothetical protein